ncbi:protein of unknown function [Trichlorobacter ammonificans]|uniref:Uncharacterized protein n=1 Tax=Trichlorobacter ammonificans TaxID=2916410 RepID=A0ABN8HMP9_9BACT|nr:protein of unknown function [Trichlorobacter ammonificans]
MMLRMKESGVILITSIFFGQILNLFFAPSQSSVLFYRYKITLYPVYST